MDEPIMVPMDYHQLTLIESLLMQEILKGGTEKRLNMLKKEHAFFKKVNFDATEKSIKDFYDGIT